jgi:hypothetical protein
MLGQVADMVLQLLLQQMKQELSYRSMVMRSVLNSRAIQLVGVKELHGSSQLQQQQLLEAEAGGLPRLKKAITTAMKSSSSSSSSRHHMGTELMRKLVKRSMVSSRLTPCTVAEGLLKVIM